MGKAVGKTIGDLTLKRNDKVLSIASVSHSVTIKNGNIVVNSQQLFNRIVCVLQSMSDFWDFLKYEFATSPPSLFDDMNLSKTTKAVWLFIYMALLPLRKDTQTLTYWSLRLRWWFPPTCSWLAATKYIWRGM